MSVQQKQLTASAARSDQRPTEPFRQSAILASTAVMPLHALSINKVESRNLVNLVRDRAIEGRTRDGSHHSCYILNVAFGTKPTKKELKHLIELVSYALRKKGIEGEINYCYNDSLKVLRFTAFENYRFIEELYTLMKYVRTNIGSKDKRSQLLFANMEINVQWAKLSKENRLELLDWYPIKEQPTVPVNSTCCFGEGRVESNQIFYVASAQAVRMLRKLNSVNFGYIVIINHEVRNIQGEDALKPEDISNAAAVLEVRADSTEVSSIHFGSLARRADQLFVGIRQEDIALLWNSFEYLPLVQDPNSLDVVVYDLSPDKLYMLRTTAIVAVANGIAKLQFTEPSGSIRRNLEF